MLLYVREQIDLINFEVTLIGHRIEESQCFGKHCWYQIFKGHRNVSMKAKLLQIAQIKYIDMTS